MTVRTILAALALGVAGAAGAEDLVQVYRDAQRYDAQFAAARHALTASREKLPQGEALLKPTVNLSANATQSYLDVDSRNSNVSPSFNRDSRVLGTTLSLAHPLYRKQNEIQRDQAGYQVEQAEAVFSLAGQDLILRAAQAYFDVLAAQDTLGLVRAQRAAISEQLAQAKRNFEVGTATITDTHEAQARYDLNGAQEIAAQNDLDNKIRNLQQLTGKEYTKLQGLKANVDLTGPTPADMQKWVDLAERQSHAVRAQQALDKISALEARRTSAAHLPTLDLVASQGLNSQNSSVTSSVGSNSSTTTIGLQFAMPLYQGGAITSREREAAALMEKSRQDLEAARRAAALAARQSYLAVINGVAQIKALEQALVSSQSALDSNKLGYEVGVRINIDVLNAQQQLFATRRDLALARYNTILSHLRLKSAAGSLSDADLDEVNRALAQ